MSCAFVFGVALSIWVTSHIVSFVEEGRANEPECVTNVTPEAIVEVEVEEVDELQTIPLGKFRISFYCTCPKCCKKWSKFKRTAIGTKADYRRNIIAVDPRVIPMRSDVFIDGLGWFTAEDKGSKIKGRRIDVLVRSHKQATKLGIQRRHVELEKE
jgi:3D (Asp-Asp-Asp) domain-containing protein